MTTMNRKNVSDDHGQEGRGSEQEAATDALSDKPSIDQHTDHPHDHNGVLYIDQAVPGLREGAVQIEAKTKQPSEGPPVQLVASHGH